MRCEDVGEELKRGGCAQGMFVEVVPLKRKEPRHRAH